MTATSPGAPVIRVVDGTVAYDGRPVVRGVDLSVPRGDVLAILGSNGSGKSTLVRAMLGLTPLARGQVELFGVPLAGFRERHRIGYVPQRSTAASGVPATVWEVVSSGRLSRRKLARPLGRSDRAAIRAAIDAVGLADRTRHGVSTLSGGQQQRVLMARALAGEPEVLLLDEPNAGVDVTTQHAFAAALSELASSGATVVVVLHELGPLEPLIRRAVMMREGRIAYDGDPRLLSSHGEHDHGFHHQGYEPPDFLPRVTAPLDADPDEGER